jgi:hypothetical protein
MSIDVEKSEEEQLWVPESLATPVPESLAT